MKRMRAHGSVRSQQGTNPSNPPRWFCSASVSLALFFGKFASQIRRRDAGATKTERRLRRCGVRRLAAAVFGRSSLRPIRDLPTCVQHAPATAVCLDWLDLAARPGKPGRHTAAASLRTPHELCFPQVHTCGSQLRRRTGRSPPRRTTPLQRKIFAGWAA